MKILITGGCGFLGSNLAEDTLAHGDELAIFDNLSRDGSIENLRWLRSNAAFKYYPGDIRNQNDITRVIVEFAPNAIFHLAGQVAMTTSIANPRMDFETNTIGTLNVLEAVRQFMPDCVVIYSSTNKVYGDMEQFHYIENDMRYLCPEYEDGFTEDIPLSFASPYGCSKGAADQYILDYARIFGLKSIVFRHSSMYGGRQFATYDQGWVGWFCQQAVKTRRNARHSFTISGTGKQVRDVLHAEDMKTLYRQGLLYASKASGEAFNIGGGAANSMSLLELLCYLEEKLEVSLNYKKVPVRASDQKVFIADISKAKDVLKWVPSISAQSGVASMLKWVEAHI